MSEKESKISRKTAIFHPMIGSICNPGKSIRLMILSSENVKNSEKVAVNEGEQTNITFDLSRNNMNIIVSEWGTVVQTVTIG